MPWFDKVAAPIAEQYHKCSEMNWLRCVLTAHFHMQTHPICIVSIVLCTRGQTVRFDYAWADLRPAVRDAHIWERDHKVRQSAGHSAQCFSFDKNKVSKLWILMRGSKLWLHSRSFPPCGWTLWDGQAYRGFLQDSTRCVDHSNTGLSAHGPDLGLCFIDKTVADYLHSIFSSDYLRGFGVWPGQLRLTVGHTPQSHLMRRICFVCNVDYRADWQLGRGVKQTNRWTAC